MLTIDKYEVKEGGRVWADMVEKTAFDLSLDPANLIASIAGGYAATRVQGNIAESAKEREDAKKTLENDHYQQVGMLLNDLKIVFTPINVVYSVNGQVFEIVRADEMTPYMRTAFLQKDGEYFKNLLLSKMNMEMQLAEQAFAKRLLSQNGSIKEASYLDKQDYMIKLASDDFDKIAARSLKGLEDTEINIPVNFDSLRPFDTSSFFFDRNQLSKVAGMFDYFKESPYESIDLKDLKAQVKIGFLPDRVVFLHNGQLLEQLSVMNMNAEGYEKFRKKDREFFMDFFNKEAENISTTIQTPPEAEELLPQGEEQLAEEEEQEVEKVAESLEEIIEDLEIPAIERNNINIFKDADIHPFVYEKVLKDKYGKNWTTFELEAIIKQIELDFNVTDGLADNPLNKIAVIHTIASDKTTMFTNSFSFEKFLRTVNDKAILFQEFQGNLDFEEIMFGIEIAKAFKGDDVFSEFHYSLAEYVSEELFNNDVRLISDQLYDETNPEEHSFFESVNGFLMRRWKETDTHSMEEDALIESRKRATELMTHMTRVILSNHAQHIEIANPFISVQRLIVDKQFLDNVSVDMRDAVKNIVTENTVRHLGVAVFLESRREEMREILAKIEGKGV